LQRVHFMRGSAGDHRADLDHVVRFQHAAFRYQHVTADDHRRARQEAELAQHVGGAAAPRDLELLALWKDGDVHRDQRG
jgi:hypothetical protein